MINFLNVLLSVNRVKRELNKIFRLLAKLTKNQTDIIKRLTYIEMELEDLHKDSHPPMFTKKQYKSMDDRIQLLEAFFNSLEKVGKNDKDVAN